MALLDGKQLRNQSTELGKLSGSGIVSFTAATMSFTAGSVLTTATSNIVNPTDVVNKEYVDSVAAGLDPKQSVAYTTTGNITLSTRELQANGDWSQALDNGDRILVKDQTDKTENGIYVADDGAWTRATDHDGTPANEVTLGNFTFVEYGTLAGSGYVLHSTDSGSTPIITPGSDEQEWTLYSQAGAYTAGTGLNLTDGEFEIDATGVAAGSYGSADSTTTFTVNDEGQLTAAADTQISIIASQVTDFDLAAETAIFEDPNFVDGTTIEFDVTAGDSVTAEVSDSSLTSAKLDTGSNGGATAGYVLSVDGSGDFKWILDEGDISSVEAGNGLIGGGDEGDVTLNLGGTVSSDITFNFTNSANLSLGSFGNEIENFNTHAHEILIMGHKANGIPTGNLTITEGQTVLSGDVIDGNVVVMGNTASISGSKDVSIIAATGKLDMNSPEINVGTGFSTDVKIKGDYTTIEGETLDVTTNLVSIDSGTGPSQFLSGTDTTISASASLNLTAEEGNVTTGDGKGLQYTADYSSTFVDNSLVTKKYVDSLDAAQITGVSAGNGLLGGGTAGDVTLNLGGTVSSDIVFSFTASTSNNNNNSSFILQNAETIGFFGQQTSVFAVDVKEVSVSGRYGNSTSSINLNQGAYITSGHTIGLDAGTVSVTGTDKVAISGPSNSQLLMSTDGHMLMSTPEGSILVTSALGDVALTTASGDARVTTATGDATLGSGTNTLVLGTSSNTFTDGVNTKGIEYAADYSVNFTDRSLVDKAYADTKVSGVTAGAGLSGGGADGDITLNADLTIDGGLTFSSTGDAGTIEVVVDNTTIQVVNGALAVVAGTSQPVYQSATSSVTNGDTGITLTSTPNDYSRIEVYVNGQLQNLTENTTGDCYFGAAGTVLTSLTSGDSLYWNSANAGFELSATDVIKVHYQA